MDIVQEISSCIATLHEVNNVLSRRTGYTKTVQELRKAVLQLQTLLETYEKEEQVITEYRNVLEKFFSGR